MKIKILTFLLIFNTLSNVFGQGIEDALRFSQKNPTGTARTMAMGNAFGALGADLSTTVINPAGIAFYRGSEVTFTPSIVFNNSKGTSINARGESNQTTFAPNQLGVVWTFKPLRESTKGVVSSSLGLSYNRMANHNISAFIKGTFDPIVSETSNGIRNYTPSLLDAFRDEANGKSLETLNKFRAGLAYEVYLLDELRFQLGGEDISFNNQYYHAYQKPSLFIETDSEGNKSYVAEISDRTLNGLQKGKVIEQDGNTNEYNINYGLNISNVLFLGATMGVETLRFDEHTIYHEAPNGGLTPTDDPSWDEKDIASFDYHSFLEQRGRGVNFKLGAIIKPVNSIRLGLAFHTPTYYSIDEVFWNKMTSSFLNGDKYSRNSASIGEYSYSFRTPSKLIVSSAFVVGNIGILSVDYENVDYSNSKFKSSDQVYDDFSGRNNEIKTKLKNAGNLRIGAEIKLLGDLSLRAGYSKLGNPYSSESLLKKTIDSFSGGFGYRSRYYFVDFAYRYSKQQTDFAVSNWESNEYSSLARMKIYDHQVAVTVGYRF